MVQATAVGARSARDRTLSLQEQSLATRAEVDANIVMTDTGRFVEFQATAEHKSFDDLQMDQMRHLARAGVADLIALQKRVIETA